MRNFFYICNFFSFYIIYRIPSNYYCFFWEQVLINEKKMAERPKRPLSAYMIWLNETRESIKKESPGIKVTEIAKRGGELWRELTDKSVS